MHIYVIYLLILLSECRKQRYVYGAILESIGKVKGYVKFDLDMEPETGKRKLEIGGNVKGIFDLGPGRFGSDAVFVPCKPTLAAAAVEDEDDGYLIFFVHDENTGYALADSSRTVMIILQITTIYMKLLIELPNRKSSAYVIDAKTMSADPVAVVELPHRVPYGFHGFFLREVSISDFYGIF